MSQRNRSPLPDRIAEAAEACLAAQDYVAPIDVLARIGWLAPSSASQWRQGRIECLEEAIQTPAPRISQAMAILQTWAAGKGLAASETDYVARSPQREALRFTRGGDLAMERVYRTHWVSPALSEKERERVVAKANRPAELVVIEPLKDWTCHRCGGTGGLLLMEKPGPSCLACVGLGGLVLLPAGDALLTRRAKAKSTRHAVVVRFSKSRGRYERQGILVEPQALAEVQRELER